MTDAEFNARARGEQIIALWDDEDGVEIAARAVVYPGLPEVGPEWSHGGLPADGMEIDQIQVAHFHRWVDPETLPWIDPDEVERKLWKAVEEGGFLDERNL